MSASDISRFFSSQARARRLCGTSSTRVYENLSASEEAVGYVDPVTQIGIDLGYVVMVGGTLVLAAIAVWSAVAYIRLVLRGR